MTVPLPTACSIGRESDDQQNHSTRDLILGAAIRLFGRDGIAATGVDAIIREAGVARMTLYNQFGSKERLVAAALEFEGATWRRWFFARLATFASPPRERLIAMFDILAEWFARDDYFGCALMNAVLESRNSNDVLLAITTAHKQPVLEQIHALAVAAGADDPARLADQLDLIMNGAIVNAVFARSPQAAEQAKLIASALIESSLPA